MGIEGSKGPWADDETRVLIGAYFSMLARELKGEAYSKIEHNRLVQRATGRSKGSIEFKFCNISHVLCGLERPYINGYKPRSHVQDSLRNAIKVFLGVDTGSPPSLPTDRAVAAGREFMSIGGATLTETVEGGGASYAVFAGFWDRATGGTDVAARPDHAVDDTWPVAASAAGVDAALEWFTRPTSPHELPRLLFLVGGPGAGKSHASARAVAGLHLVSSPTDGLAQRTYLYAGDHSDVLIVNDATIGNHQGASAPLATDIDQIVSVSGTRPLHLMACVNRGILVEELSDLERKRDGETDQGAAGASVVRWLAEAEAIDSEWRLDSLSKQRFVRSATLEHLGRPRAHILAVYVDECSLFEPVPDVQIAGNMVTSAGSTQVTRLTERASLGSDASPAHDLLGRVAAKVADHPTPLAYEADPIQANVEMLQHSSVRSAVLTLGRSAEMASGLRFTYRELWGLISRIVVGDAPIQMGRAELEQFIADHQPSGTALERFTSLRELAALRGVQAMFGAGRGPARSDEARRDPVLRLMTTVDPVKDAIPGNRPDDPGSGWATPLDEAFASHYSESSPLAVLRARDTGALNGVIQSFDEVVDSTYVELMRDTSLKETDRLAAIAWYGSYLMRLYAVAHGISAFRREISVLLDAAFHSPSVPDVLLKTLPTLIRPQRKPGSGTDESLLPLYDSRAEPILGWAAVRKLAIFLPSLDLKTEPIGADQTVLILLRNSKELGRIALDFALVREALACVDDHAGVTDLVDATSPRLERIRAVHLRSTVLADAQLRIANGYTSSIVTLKSVKGA